MNHPTYVHVVAFASASSAATIPVSTECVQSTGLVPESIIRFVIPLGATVVGALHCIACRRRRRRRRLRLSCSIVFDRIPDTNLSLSHVISYCSVKTNNNRRRSYRIMTMLNE
jgi:hypothetical protein